MNSTGRNRTLVLLCGGRSAEHEVSLMSTAAALRSLEAGRLQVSVVGIDRQGGTLRADSLRSSLGEALGDGAECPETDSWIEYLGSLDARTHVVFPMLHGPYGEDGTVQGLLEVLNLPYVGAGVGGSAVGMNKLYTKRILQPSAVPVLPWVSLNRVDWQARPEELLQQCGALGGTVFVKPAALGSSVGISKCGDAGAIQAGIELALRYDDFVLVERGVEAREIEVSVLGNLNPEVSLPGEIVPGDEFYSYAAKYLDGTSRLLIPAPLEDSQTERIRSLALLAYAQLQLEGMARVDFLLDKSSGDIWLNEVNTIPGFTPISMYPKMWEASGLAYTDLIERLVDLAVERWQRRSRLSTDR